MKAIILAAAEADLEAAFDHYEAQRTHLGLELLTEFRHGVDLILEFPDGWQLMDKTMRRYRMHRFPFAIIYRILDNREFIIIEAIMHTSRKPGRPRA